MASGAQSHDRTFVATHSIDDGSNTALIVSPADAGPFDGTQKCGQTAPHVTAIAVASIGECHSRAVVPTSCCPECCPHDPFVCGMSRCMPIIVIVRRYVLPHPAHNTLQRPYTKKEGVYFKLTIAQLDRRKGHVVVYSRISQVNATQPAFCYLISFNLVTRRCCVWDGS